MAETKATITGEEEELALEFMQAGLKKGGKEVKLTIQIVQITIRIHLNQSYTCITKVLKN